MAKGYRFVEHTSEVEFEASGRTINECFRNSLLAMFDTICYIGRTKRSKSKPARIRIKDNAKSLDDLLWYSLQDALSASDSRGLFAYSVKQLQVEQLNGKYMISFEISTKGKSDNLSRLEVKGVSRYNTSVKESGKTFKATAVLDV